jgi:hypothetical protein
MTSTDRRREFGAYLAGLRRRAGRSQPQLAAALCTASGTQSITRNEVSRWERGARVPDTWLPFLAVVYGVPLRELEQAAAYARGDTLATLPTGTLWSPWQPPAGAGSGLPPWRVWRLACTASGSRTTCCRAGT